MLSLLIAAPVILSAQLNRSLTADVEVGAAVITSNQVKKVYGAGMKLLAGPKVALNASENLWLRVHGGFQWHFKEIEEENSITDHLRIWKAGTQLEYFFSTGRVHLAAVAGLNYNWCANYFSATYAYNPWTNTSQTVTSDKFLKGTGLSADIGALVSFNNFFIKTGYEYLNPLLTVNPEIVKSASNEGLIIPEEYRYNLSSLYFHVGYTVNLSR